MSQTLKQLLSALSKAWNDKDIALVKSIAEKIAQLQLDHQYTLTEEELAVFVRTVRADRFEPSSSFAVCKTLLLCTAVTSVEKHLTMWILTLDSGVRLAFNVHIPDE